MARKVKNQIMEVIAGFTMVIGCFLIGGYSGHMIQNSDWTDQFFITYDEIAKDGESDLNSSEKFIIRVEGDDLNEEEQARMNWLFKSKQYEIENDEVLDRLESLNYQVKLIDDLINIPAEIRTTDMQEQLLQGSGQIVLDQQSRTIWCEYQAPENVLTQTILSIE